MIAIDGPHQPPAWVAETTTGAPTEDGVVVVIDTDADDDGVAAAPAAKFPVKHELELDASLPLA